MIFRFRFSFLRLTALSFVLIALTTFNWYHKQDLLPQTIIKNTDSPGNRLYLRGESEYGRGGVIVMTSQSPPEIKAGSYDESGSAKLKLYKANKDLLLNYLVHDDENKQLNPVVETNNLEFVAETSVEVKSGYNTDQSVNLPFEDSGVYYIETEFNDFKQGAFVVRSRNSYLVKEGNNEFVFWGTDGATKRSLKSGQIEVFDLEGKRQIVSTSFINEEGITTAPLYPGADLAIAESGGDIALIPINLTSLNYNYSYDYFDDNNESGYKAFLFTDRPLYKPGDTIYFKAIVRSDNDALYTLPKAQPLVSVYRGWSSDGDKVYERRHSFNSSGTVFGQIVLPEDARTGNYTFKVDMDPGNSSYVTKFTKSFDVEYFRKPEYYIESSVLDTDYVKGDQIVFDITGSYFFGKPISNGKVEYEIKTSDAWNYSYYFQPNLDYDYYRWGYRYGTRVQEGSTAFDELGKTEVVVDTSTLKDFDNPKVLTLNAEYIDETGNPAYTSKNVIVFPGEFSVYLSKKYKYIREGETLEIPFILQAVNGDNVSGVDLKTYITRKYWLKENDKYTQKTQDIGERSAKTNSKGEAQISLANAQSGSYEVRVEAIDGSGNLIKKEFRFWVSGSGGWYSAAEDTFSITTDKEQYEPGENVRLFISSEVKDRDIFVSFDRARLHKYRVVKVEGNSAEVEIPLVESDMPNVYVSAAAFGPNYIETHDTKISVSAQRQKIDVKLTADKDEYGPGDTVTLNVETTDRSGNPVAADTAVWAVDKSIFELVDQPPLNIFDTFWRERYNSTSMSHSLRGINVNPAERGGGCFVEGTNILTPNGLVPIEDIKPGDTVLTHESESNSELVKAKVSGVHKKKSDGYLVINELLKVTPNHILFVNNNWQTANSVEVGDTLLYSDGHQIIVDSVYYQTGKVDVYNLSVAEYNTFIADGIWVHNQKGGPTPRDNFEDTAYWNPALSTGSDGRATIRFTLPDNLTTWVVAGIANTNDTKVGAATTEVVATKDVIIRPVLPNIIRIGDTIELYALVSNFTGVDRSFVVTLETGNGLVLEGEIEPITIDIENGDYKEVSWTAQVLGGSGKGITYAIEAQDSSALSDTIKLDVLVVPFGFKEISGASFEGSFQHKISFKDDTDLENSTVTLSLSPSLFSMLPSAMTYLVDYPYGCVEQTTSRFVPAVIARANLNLFGEALKDKDLDDIITKGISRLKKLQQNDGGWSWWSTGSSDPFVTAYVIEYLVQAKNQGYNVDASLFDGAKTFLESRKLPESGKMFGDDVMVAYALSVLGSEKASVAATNFELAPDLLAYAIIYNANLGNIDPASNGLNTLLNKAAREGNTMYWTKGENERYGSNDATTALALRAIIAGGGTKTDAAAAARYLVNNKKANRWHNTFATAQVLAAAADYEEFSDEASPNYTYEAFINGKQIAKGSVNSVRNVISPISIDLSDLDKSEATIELVKAGGSGELYSSVEIEEFRTSKQAEVVDNGITVFREYSNAKGGHYNISVGDVVDVNLTVKADLQATDRYLVIEDQLPSGLVPINNKFENEAFQQNTQRYNYGLREREFTQNGVILSFYRVNSITKISYKARAVNAGVFSTPPTIASFMYNPEIYGRTTPAIITIENESRQLYSPLVITREKAKQITQAIRRFRMAPIIAFVVAFTTLLIIKKRRPHELADEYHSKVQSLIQNLVHKLKKDDQSEDNLPDDEKKLPN